MIKYMEMSELNNDQARLIKEKGWCVFTECYEEGTYYNKGFSWANRCGYIILSEDVGEDVMHINSEEELNRIASYDKEFADEVKAVLSPIEDKCYVFLVKDPAYYHFEQVWTNKGLEHAKETAKLKFRHKHQYYESGTYDKMQAVIDKHNSKVKEDTEKAVELLKANGFTVVSKDFAVLLQ